MNLTDENFEAEITEAKLPVLVDFFAEWCGPCQMLSPLLDKIADEMKNKLIMAKVNVEETPKMSQKFGAERIPTVILFKNGQPVSGFVGMAGEREIKNWLNNNLEK